MPTTTRSRRGEATLWASDLADGVVCPYRLHLAQRMGQVETSAQRQTRQHGSAVHGQLHRAAVRRHPGLSTNRSADIADSRCFIATTLFGPLAPETHALRQFRDQVLLSCVLGRWLVQAYYTTSPALVRWIERHPALRPACQKLVGLIARSVSTIRLHR